MRSVSAVELDIGPNALGASQARGIDGHEAMTVQVEQNVDARLIGLAVPGVPETSATFEARIMPVPGWTVSAAWRYVGEYEVDALNTMQATSYGLVDLGVAYVHDGVRSFRVYANVNNVTDREYSTSTSVIGGQELFAPGAPRAYRAGIQFNF